jgi:predicted thioesterase
MRLFENIKAGMSADRSFVVEERFTTSRIGTPVLSTPMMILLMEKTCADLVGPLLPPAFTTVGFEVNVRHRAPARLAATISVSCKLLEVDERKLHFEVRVCEGEKVIGEGTHRRTIISTAR